MSGPTIDEGILLRGLLGMLVKKRTADADMLELSQESVQAFLTRYTVGITHDATAGCYLIVVQRRDPTPRIETGADYG